MFRDIVRSVVVSAGAGEPSPVQGCWGRRASVPAMLAIALMCLCTYLPTVHQRSHYMDDYPNRMAVERGNVWGACLEYWANTGCGTGLVRPLGYVTIFSCQQWLWDYPVIQQAIMLAVCVAMCLLLYLVALRLTGDPGVALAAGAILAAWPSYTSVVVWVATGLQMLPAYATFLAALLLYLRHLSAIGTWKWWAASLVVFAMSISFHNQHLGAVAAFSVLACMCGPAGRRMGLMLGPIPFWLLALVVGLTGMITARGSTHPLEPTVTNVIEGLGAVIGAFFSISLSEPVRCCLYGAGPRLSISRMMEADPALLVVSVLMLLTATGLAVTTLHRVRPSGPSEKASAKLAIVGAVIMLAGLVIMASRDRAVFWPRHTLLPAIGLSLVLGSALGVLQTRRVRTVGVVLLAGLLVGLSIFRLGYTYEWTTRTRVTEEVLAALDELYPRARADDLLVIDGVRKYGPGFLRSWELCWALSIRRGTQVRVTTLVRREDDRLYANAAWERKWEIDPAAARFFSWCDDRRSLRAMTFEEFLARHPELRSEGG